jgi:hypothetical protein
MVYLPDEIWLHIASHCDAADLWLSLRRVDRQLHRCAEQYFRDHHIPRMGLDLVVSIPSYDMRNPQIGRATFYLETESEATAGHDSVGRVTFRHLGIAPAHYHSHFMARWTGMQRSSNGGLNERMHWNIYTRGVSLNVRLKEAIIEETRDDDVARLSFDWRFPVTALLQHHSTSKT